jgi:HPr kinase/phosphorylase
MNRPTVQQLFQDLQDPLGLEALTPLPDAPILLVAQDVHRPGMAVMGFLENFLSERIQIMGESEMSYLATLDAAGQVAAFGRVLALLPPVIVVTRSLPVPEPVLALARERSFPLLRSTRSAVTVTRELNRHLERAFAPAGEVHGTLVDVYGVGLLFTGRSGIGKSECALDLIGRGHRLVADDTVEIRCRGEAILIGTCPELTRHHVEIRGLGLINVTELFGVASTRSSKRVELVVQLERWDESREYDRLGLDVSTTDILGISVPLIVMPVAPGRSVGLLIEVAARNQLRRARGRHAARELTQRLERRLEQLADRDADELEEDL